MLPQGHAGSSCYGQFKSCSSFKLSVFLEFSKRFYSLFLKDKYLITIVTAFGTFNKSLRGLFILQLQLGYPVFIRDPVFC